MADFHKYHGLGNDYLVIDPAEFPFVPDPAAVRVVCDRNYGVGSDGILLGPGPDPAHPALRILNPDGSEAEKSGNGLRIFAWFLYEKGLAGAGPFPIKTLGGRVTARIVDPARKVVRVDMGPPAFDARSGASGAGLDEVLDREFAFGGETCRITFVSMGNPHCVVLGRPVTPEEARRLGPVIERSPLFPARTNVQLLEVLSRSEIRIEIWERGAGYTLASGSSSSAAAAVAHRLGLCGPNITVHMPGGDLGIRLGPDFAVDMTGPVARVGEAALAAEALVAAPEGI